MLVVNCAGERQDSDGSSSSGGSGVPRGALAVRLNGALVGRMRMVGCECRRRWTKVDEGGTAIALSSGC